MQNQWQKQKQKQKQRAQMKNVQVPQREQPAFNEEPQPQHDNFQSKSKKGSSPLMSQRKNRNQMKQNAQSRTSNMTQVSRFKRGGEPTASTGNLQRAIMDNQMMEDQKENIQQNELIANIQIDPRGLGQTMEQVVDPTMFQQPAGELLSLNMPVPPPQPPQSQEFTLDPEFA